jgi:hypothetical protein
VGLVETESHSFTKLQGDHTMSAHVQIESVNTKEQRRVWHPARLVRYAVNFLLMFCAKFANTMVIDTNGVQVVEKFKTIVYKVTLTGNYVQAVRLSNVGEVMIPNNATNPALLPGGSWGLTGPTRAYIINGPAGLGAEMLPGADNFHWLLKLFNPTTGAELAAGAYAALNLADLDFKIAFEGRNID